MADIVTNAAVSASTQTSSKPATSTRGLQFERHFTRPGVSPFDELTWELRDAIIQDWKGKLIFEQRNVESPPTGR